MNSQLRRGCTARYEIGWVMMYDTLQKSSDAFIPGAHSDEQQISDR